MGKVTSCNFDGKQKVKPARQPEHLYDWGDDDESVRQTSVREIVLYSIGYLIERFIALVPEMLKTVGWAFMLLGLWADMRSEYHRHKGSDSPWRGFGLLMLCCITVGISTEIIAVGCVLQLWFHVMGAISGTTLNLASVAHLWAVFGICVILYGLTAITFLVASVIHAVAANISPFCNS